MSRRRQSDLEDAESVARPDRTERRHEGKRVAAEAFALVKSLTSLPEDKLAALPIDSSLLDALLEIRRMKLGTARQRQLRYVARRVLEDQVDAAAAALAAVQIDKIEVDEREKTAIAWRDRLVDEGEPATEDFVGLCPPADRQTVRQQVRQLTREARKARTATTSPRASRQLLRLVRGWLAETEPDEDD